MRGQATNTKTSVQPIRTPQLSSPPEPSLRAPRVRFAWVLSFEAVIVVLLFRGLRNDVQVQLIPHDWLTIGGWILSVTGGAYLTVRSAGVTRRFRNGLALCLLFLGLASVSLAGTPAPGYGKQKVLLFAVLNIWLFIIGALIIGPSRFRLFRLGAILYANAAVFMIGTLYYTRLQTGSVFVSILGADYLTISKILGYGVLLGLGYLLLMAGKRRTRLAVAGCTLGMVYSMFLVGGRGPLLAAAVASALFGVAYGRFGSDHRGIHPRRRLLILVALFTLLLVPTVAASPAVTVERLLVLLHDPGHGASAQIRLEDYRDSLSLWKRNLLFGYGAGSWPALVGQGDVRTYPHNMVLEVGVEFGAAGVALLFVMMVYCIAAIGSLARLRRDPFAIVLLVLVAYQLASAQVSGDLIDHRDLFLLLGLCLAVPLLRRRTIPLAPQMGNVS